MFITTSYSTYYNLDHYTKSKEYKNRLRTTNGFYEECKALYQSICNRASKK